jgi:phage regulator Rha-like protein
VAGALRAQQVYIAGQCEILVRGFIAADGDTLTTTSKQVFVVFEKRHDAVLRDIRALLSDLPMNRHHNFVETVEMRANPSGGAAIPSVR